MAHRRSAAMYIFRCTTQSSTSGYVPVPSSGVQLLGRREFRIMELAHYVHWEIVEATFVVFIDHCMMLIVH